MLGWAKTLWKWIRPNDAVPNEQGYRYPASTTWCAQKLVHFSPLFQSTQWKILPLPTINGLLIWWEFHAQNCITSRWKCRQELLSCSSVIPCPWYSQLSVTVSATAENTMAGWHWVGRYHKHFTSIGSDFKVILIIWETMQKSTRWIEWWMQQ